MPKNKTSFWRQATIILVLAGSVILWDSFSATRGGMWSILAVALALLLIGSMYMGQAHHSEPNVPEPPDNDASDEMEKTMIAPTENEDRASKAKLN